MFLMPIYKKFDVGKVVIEIRFEDNDENGHYKITCNNREIEFEKNFDKNEFMFGELNASQVALISVLFLNKDIWEEVAFIRVPTLDHASGETITPIEDRLGIPNELNNKLNNRMVKSAYVDTMAYEFDYITPYRPYIQHQDAMYKKEGDRYSTKIGYVNSCVANTASAMIECFQNAEGGEDYKLTSVSWIWGGIGLSDSFGTMYYDAWNFLISQGSPPYELMMSNHVDKFPDNYFLSDRNIDGVNYIGAKTLYGQKKTEAKQYANANRVESWEELIMERPTSPDDEMSGVNVGRVQDAIMSITHSSNRKAVIMTIEIDETFDSVGSDGIVRDIVGDGSSRGGHCLLVLGWKKINGKRYWICQNSWGNNWGDNGLCYIRFSWSTIWLDVDGNGDWYIRGSGIRSFYIFRDGTYPMPPMPKPKPPVYNTNKGVNGREDGSVYLKWDTYANATRYKLYSVDVNRPSDTPYVYEVTGTEYQLNLGYSKRSYVWITAILSDGKESMPSSKNICTAAPAYIEKIEFVDGYTNGIQVKNYVYRYGTSAVERCVTHRYNSGMGYMDSKEANVTSGNTIYYTQWDGIDTSLEYNFIAYGKNVVDGVTILSTKPSNTITFSAMFYWDFPKVSGQEFKVTVNEWIRFMEAINKKLKLKGKPIINYTKPNVGDGFSASIFNQARSGLINLSASNIPPIANIGSPIYANYFEQLKESFNKVK